MTMRGVVVLPFAFCLAGFFPSRPACSNLLPEGSITKVDVETYHLRCEFVGVSLPEWAVPPWGDCSRCDSVPDACREFQYYLESYSSFSLEGRFGTAENISCDYVSPNSSPDYVVCMGYALEVDFDFKASNSEPLLRIDYQVDLEWSIETYVCGSFGGRSSRGEPFSGTVLGDLPQDVGDSSPLRRIPDAVDAKSWSRVKQLYR
jgi:hypothetical protein